MVNPLSLNDLPDIQLTASPVQGSPALFRISLPVPAGVLPAGQALGLRLTDGLALPCQTRPLLSWPDGSVRWLEIVGLNTTAGCARLLSEDPVPPTVPIVVETTGPEAITVRTGELRLTVDRAGIAELALAGRELLRSGAGMQLRLVLADGRVGDFVATSGPELEEAGPVRVQLRLVGALTDESGATLLAVSLCLTIVAGQTLVGVHVTFSHEQPGVAAYDIRSLSLQLLPAAPTGLHQVFQKNRGMLCLTQDVETRRPVDIRVSTDHARAFVADRACFEDPEVYPEIMPDIFDHTEPVLSAAVGGDWLSLLPVDFVEMTPQGLTAEAGALAYHILPDWAPPTHLLQGRGRRVQVQIIASAGVAAPATVALRQRQAAVLDLARARGPVDWYRRHAGFGLADTLPTEPAGPRRFDRFLRRLGRLPTVLGMWDLGDTVDSGYSRTYAANHSTRRLAEPPKARFASSNHFPLIESSRGLTHEPVWANNEYDALLALGREWLRTDLPAEHYRRLCWFGRHAIEVDFVSYSDLAQLHHGTPAHSADHQRATAYPSHLWAEGLLLYSLIAGDADALDVARKQGHFILNAFTDPGLRRRLWSYSRELGWALLHLAALATHTGESRFREGAEELAVVLARHPLTTETYEQMTVGAFGMVSIALGIHATWELTRDPALAHWLVTVSRGIAHQVVERGLETPEPAMLLPYFSAACLVSGDPEHLRPGLHVLEQVMDSDYWRQPPMEAKPVAMMHRGLVTWLGLAHHHGLLADLDYRHYPGPEK